MRFKAALSIAVLVFAAASLHAAPADYFGIHVTDADTGRGIPLVRLRTTFKQDYWTDSAGYVAFAEPGLVDKDVWFDVASCGYEDLPGRFDLHGVKLRVKPGTASEIKLHRSQIAERLYRQTGFGVYRDSVLLGKPVPILQPLLNAQVTGQDTIQTAIYNGKMYWFWQDTDQVGFGLGNYSMTGATTPLPEKLDPDRGIDFTYFTKPNGGFARAMASIDQKGASHPIWVDGLIVVKDDTGAEKMIGRFVAANKDFSPADAGLVLWDDKDQTFKRWRTFEDKHAFATGGDPLTVLVDGVPYCYFTSPYCVTRVKKDWKSVGDLSAYEAFTCLKPGTTYDKANPPLNRDAAGKLLWTWQQGAKPLNVKQAEELIASHSIAREETPFQTCDADTGKPLRIARSSVAWNPYAKRWTMIFGQSGGDSQLGELWYATANSPEGPWKEAKKVATHAMKENNNSCYNPIQHRGLMREGGRYVYFEGTYVTSFSGNPHPTPYYDYNNILYRIDLSDPRLKLPDPPPPLGDAKPAEMQ